MKLATFLFCIYCPIDFCVAVPYNIHRINHESTQEFYEAQVIVSQLKTGVTFVNNRSQNTVACSGI